MATYTEYLAEALRTWRDYEQILRRAREDGAEGERLWLAEKDAAEAFAKAVDTHLMAVEARSHR